MPRLEFKGKSAVETHHYTVPHHALQIDPGLSRVSPVEPPSLDGNLIVEGLSARYELVEPGGAFYAFPKTPWGTGGEFVAKAIEEKLLIIPGSIFSHRDTHFRISYAADDAVIERGIEALNRLAR